MLSAEFTLMIMLQGQANGQRLQRQRAFVPEP